MTGFNDGGHAERSASPALSVELLADLHAGVLEQQAAARLWPVAQADPQARAILAALDSTRSDLAAEQYSAVSAPIPAAVASRIDHALQAERPVDTHPSTAVASISAARKRRGARTRWPVAAGVVAAAAAAVVLLAVALPSTHIDGTPLAKPASPSAPRPQGAVVVSSARLSTAGSQVIGSSDYGPLRSATGVRACLSANKVPLSTQVAGVKPMILDGRSGVGVVLTTGRTARFRLLVVGPDCGPSRPATLADSILGEAVPPTR